MSIDPRTRIGHVHLTVSDLDRALTFYRDVLGFEVTTRYGQEAVFLSAGGYHHHIGLNTWAGKAESRRSLRPPPSSHPPPGPRSLLADIGRQPPIGPARRPPPPDPPAPPKPAARAAPSPRARQSRADPPAGSLLPPLPSRP